MDLENSDSGREPASALAYLSAGAAVLLGLFGLGYASGPHIDYFDVSMYEAMALGLRGGVTEPYASRVLGPALARAIMELTGVEARSALAIVGAASLGFLAFLSPAYLFRQKVHLGGAMTVLMVPYAVVLVRYIHVPDALTVTVVFGFLWALVGGRNVQASPGVALGALSVLARKTVLVPYALLSLYLMVARDSKRIFTLLAAGTVGIGILALIPSGAVNIHEMNSVSYYLLKPVANGISNILGVDLYTNTVQWCGDPVAVFDVSFVSFIGAITEVGYCRPSGSVIGHTLITYLTIFGAWPVLAALYLRSKDSSERVWKSLAGIFVLFFVAAPLLGRTVERLFIYAFPFLLLVAPRLVAFARRSGIWSRFLPVTSVLQAVGVLHVLLR